MFLLDKAVWYLNPPKAGKISEPNARVDIYIKIYPALRHAHVQLSPLGNFRSFLIDQFLRPSRLALPNLLTLQSRINADVSVPLDMPDQ